MVPEDLALFDRLSGAETLAFVGQVHGLSAANVRTRSAELLALMDLTRAQNDLVADYSHGMRKKIALAAALLPAPRLLFLDEPFEGVDAVASRQIRDLLAHFVRGGGTVFLTSHILEIVDRLCDHIGIINKGLLVAQGPIAELRGGAGQGRTLEDRFFELVGADQAAALARLARPVIRILRAFAWLRWRLLVNTIRSGERRDLLERISRTVGAIAPFAVGALSAGSIVAAGVLGFISGRALAGGLLAPASVILVLRVVLGVLVALTIILTVVAPTQTTMGSYTRLLLLPISRATLHVVEVAANLTDPWILMAVPGLTAFAIGLAVGGRPQAAILAAVAGIAFVLVLVSIGALVSFLLGWLLRSRRRGELFTLIFVLAVSMLSIMPALLSTERLSSRGRSTETGATGRAARRSVPSVTLQQIDASLPRWTRGVPSELYGAALNAAWQRRPSMAWLAVALLLAEAAALFGASYVVHGKMVGSLENEQGRRRRASRPLGGFDLPFVQPAVAAVALTYVRTVIRSVRGRLAILLPGPLLLAMSVILRRLPDLPSGITAVLSRGDLIFGVGSVFALHALQPFTMNLFGTDRSGLTLLFLSPLSDRDLARGKVLGCGLLLALSMSLCLVGAALLAPAGVWSGWIAVPLAVFATWALLAPMAVWISALLPVAADLSRAGAKGNPHPLAMLASLVLIMALIVPPVAIVVTANFWLLRPSLAPVLLIGWLGLALAVSWPLVDLASRSLGPRRENLALLVK